jgi:hypothetical protein
MMDLITFAGALAIARMRPVLEVARTPFLSEIDRFVDACGEAVVLSCVPEMESLQHWRRKIGPLDDSSVPEYFQSTAAGVAILAAAYEGGSNDRGWRIKSNVANFWASCDDLLHAGNGYSRSEFQGIKTTLQGVEDMWREGDVRALSLQEGDPAVSFRARLSKVRSNYPKRRNVARIVAECAGWDSSEIRDS